MNVHVLEDDVEYYVVKAPTSVMLSDAVHTKLDEGWKLYGPPFGVYRDMCQAVVRRQEDSPTDQTKR